jgi:spore coat polysaccharide biosynthesis protein SpsF
MTTAIIVQARTGSSRLPGKALENLGNHTGQKRCCGAANAFPVQMWSFAQYLGCRADDVLTPPVESAGDIIVRGSETDVLSRYAKAAVAVAATTVMRVTSDCPLIDPQICGAVLQLYARESADYASNTLERSFPKGRPRLRGLHGGGPS